MLPQIETIPPAGDAAHILLVEDDDGLRMLVTRLLRESGYRVTGCRTGAEFWRLLPAGGVDLVLLDVMLPGASGLDLLRALRAKSTVPVIMVSARNEEADRVLGLELGADDYVAKPFGRPELLARVRAVLASLRHRTVTPRRPEGGVPFLFRMAARPAKPVAPRSGGGRRRSVRCGVRPAPRVPRTSRPGPRPRDDPRTVPRPARGRRRTAASTPWSVAYVASWNRPRAIPRSSRPCAGPATCSPRRSSAREPPRLPGPQPRSPHGRRPAPRDPRRPWRGVASLSAIRDRRGGRCVRAAGRQPAHPGSRGGASTPSARTRRGGKGPVVPAFRARLVRDLAPTPGRGGRPRPVVVASPDALPGARPRTRARPGDGRRGRGRPPRGPGGRARTGRRELPDLPLGPCARPRPARIVGLPRDGDGHPRRRRSRRPDAPDRRAAARPHTSHGGDRARKGRPRAGGRPRRDPRDRPGPQRDAGPHP